MLRGQLLRKLCRWLIRSLSQVSDQDVSALRSQVRGNGGADTCNPFSSVPCVERAWFRIIALSRTSCGASDDGKLAFVDSRGCHIRQSGSLTLVCQISE